MSCYLSEYLAFIWNGLREDMVKCGNSIRCDDNQLILDIVDISDFTLVNIGLSWKIEVCCFKPFHIIEL